MPAFIHSLNPHPITGVHPITSTVDDLTRHEEEHFWVFGLTPQPAQPPFIPLWPPTELAPLQAMPPTYQAAPAPSTSSSSSSATSSVGPPLSPYRAPFVAPPPVGQVYPPAGPPP